MTDAMYNAIYVAVKEATAHAVPENDINKKIVKHLFKGCSDPELLTMPWQQACKELVERSMSGYSGACCELEWFFDIDLVPAFMVPAYELVARSGKNVPETAIQEILQAEYEAELDRKLLEKALWDVSARLFKEEKVHSKVYQSLSKSYWPAFEEVLQDGNLHREMMYGLDEATELRRVEAFARRWLDDAIVRAWATIEASDIGLNQQMLMRLVKELVAPFGEEHPYSCLPGAFIDHLGRPPQDWAYIRAMVNDLFRSWAGDGSAKKKRKTGGGGKPRPPQDEFETTMISSTRVSVPIEPEPEGEAMGHPQCTSGDDCIGTPLHGLIQHIHNGKPGDIYCEACWESFCQRNPNLKGEPYEG